MKKILIALIGAVLVLGACGDDNEPEPNETPVANEEAAGDFDATAAESTYAAKGCIGCHGGNLEGGVGPALAGTALSKDEIVAIIQAGVEGTAMNAYPDVDAENLAAWIKAQ